MRVALALALLALVATSLASPPKQLKLETPKAHISISVKGDEESSEAGAQEASAASEETEASASAEEESESAEEESSTPDLSKYVLPPEPAAAKGYRSMTDKCGDPLSNCDEENESANGEEDSNPAPSERTSVEHNYFGGKGKEACTENCEAEEANPTEAKGPMASSEPLGDLDKDNGYYTVRGTETEANPSSTPLQENDGQIIMTQQTQQGVANILPIHPQNGVPSVAPAPLFTSCGCNVCPCPTSCGCETCPCVNLPPLPAVTVSNDQVPQVVSGCGCQTCPCPMPRYVTPEERKAHKLEILNQREMAARAKEKEQLHNHMFEHQANMNKIEAMAAALRDSYANLRRHHALLRTHIAATKLTLKNLGDDSWKGTDLDIDSPQPNLWEDPEDIAPLGFNKGTAAQIHAELEKAHVDEKGTLDSHQRVQRSNVRGFFGSEVIPAEEGSAKEKKSVMDKIKDLVGLEKKARNGEEKKELKDKINKEIDSAKGKADKEVDEAEKVLKDAAKH